MSTSSTAPSDEERLSGYLSQGPAFVAIFTIFSRLLISIHS